jgi:hypothetical protein
MRTASEGATSDLSQDQTIAEIVAQYSGEWVLMRVTGYDENHWPATGFVVAHSPDEEALSTASIPAPYSGPESADTLGQRLYFFRAVPRIRSGPAYDDAAAKFVSEVAAMSGTADAERRR